MEISRGSDRQNEWQRRDENFENLSRQRIRHEHDQISGESLGNFFDNTHKATDWSRSIRANFANLSRFSSGILIMSISGADVDNQFDLNVM